MASKSDIWSQNVSTPLSRSGQEEGEGMETRGETDSTVQASRIFECANGMSGLLGPARPGETWKALHSPVWRLFQYDHGSFLLHVPSSTVVEVDEGTARFVATTLSPGSSAGDVGSEEFSKDEEADYREALAELEQSMPKTQERKVTVDISALSLNMAQGCNLRCTYCFAGEGDYGVKGMMSFETAKKAIQLLSEGKKSFHLIFFGGEPLLNFSVIEKIVSWTKTLPCQFTYAITTNGTLLNEEKIKWMNDHDFAVTISYDGKGVHAKNRLNKDKVSNSEALVAKKLKTFEAQLQQLKSFRLRSTITRDVLDGTEEALFDTLNSYGYRLSVARHADSSSRLAFTLEDIDKLSGMISRIVDSLLQAQDYEKLKKFEVVMGFVRSIHRRKTRQLSCGAGVNYLTVSVEGSFHLCHRFNEDQTEMYGSIHEGVRYDNLKEIVEVRSAQREPCKSCAVREFCAGGCFHEHKLAHGSKFVLDETFCRLLGSKILIAFRVYSFLAKNAPQILEEM